MRYSKRVESVIRFANQEAARLDHDHISTGHLLLGLIREGEGVAIEFLKDINVDLEIHVHTTSYQSIFHYIYHLYN